MRLWPRGPTLFAIKRIPELPSQVRSKLEVKEVTAPKYPQATTPKYYPNELCKALNASGLIWYFGEYHLMSQQFYNENSCLSYLTAEARTKANQGTSSSWADAAMEKWKSTALLLKQSEHQHILSWCSNGKMEKNSTTTKANQGTSSY